MVGTIIGTIIFGPSSVSSPAWSCRAEQNISMLVTVVLGILGALIGYFIWPTRSVATTPTGIDWIALVIGVAVAAVLIVVYGNVTGKKQVR